MKLMLEILGLILIAVFAILWVPYIMRTKKFGAPFVPMEPDVVGRVMEIAQVKKGDIFYDLGSGDGRLVIAAALRGAKAYGVEIDFLRVLYSRLWVYFLRLHKNAEIVHQDLFKVNLSKANIVFLYLLEETNEKLKNKLKKELKKGTRIVATGFPIPGWKLVKIEPKGTIFGPIYLYKR